MSTVSPDHRSPGLSGLTRSGGSAPAPSIPRPTTRWKTRILIPLFVLLATGGMLAYAARGMLVPAIEVRVVPVVVRGERAAPAPGEGEPDGASPAPSGGPLVQAPGWIEPDPYAVSVPALVEGVVKEVLVLEGQAVEEGQVVARLIDTELVLEEAAAAAAIAERQADIRRAEVAADQARARITVDRAAVEAAQDEVDRKRGLVTGGAVSSGEFRRMELRLEGLRAQVVVAESAVAEAEAAIAQGRAALGAAEVQQQQAHLRRSRTEIRSPQAGVVLTRAVYPGMRMAMTSSGAGAASEAGILTLYDPLKLQVRVDVPLSAASKVAVGTRAQITTEAIPDATFEGVVTRVIHEANIQRNTVQFKVAIEHPSPLLKPEMLTRVRLRPAGGSDRDGSAVTSGGGDQTTVLLSSVLVNAREDKAQVWLVENTGGAAGTTAALRDVTLGVQDGDDTVILTGVRPGDRAIVAPPGTLRHGRRVRVVGEAPGPTN